MTQVFAEGDAVGVTPIHIIGDADIAELKPGVLVTVTGVSKGKGFQGVVKRHGFHGGPQTHGQKNRLRAPGSIGNTTPQRVLPGRKMAGHMGVDTITIQNLKVVEVNAEKRIIFIRGAIPGNTSGKIRVRLAK